MPNAADRGDAETVQVLPNAVDRTGLTAICISEGRGKTDTARLLLDAGADDIHNNDYGD